jgi:predicted amidohydrolase YtcJ
LIPLLLAVALVLRGGAVYTLDPSKPWASAVVIDGRRIVYVGGDAGAKAWPGRVIELNGRMVLPGLHDSHLHPMTGGMSLLRCSLSQFKTDKEIYAAVRACDAAAKGEWLIGRGWSPRVLTPTVAKLTELVPDRPAFLTTEDGYVAWVNSKALQIAGRFNWWREAQPIRHHFAGGRQRRRGGLECLSKFKAHFASGRRAADRSGPRAGAGRRAGGPP